MYAYYRKSINFPVYVENKCLYELNNSCQCKKVKGQLHLNNLYREEV